MGYFNLQALIDKYKIPIHNKKVCLAINGERNIGKTTSMLNFFFMEQGVSENKKIAFIRNADNQREMFARDFNSRMKNRYKIQGDFIYELEKVELTKKDGTTEIHYRTGKHIGYNCAISTFLTMKSIESANLRYIVFDEYNEKTNANADIYVKFINLFTTLERNNKIFFLMMGNRDTPNNEFMVKWEILPQENIPKDDVVFKLMDNDKWFHMFIELGTEQFKDLENENTLSHYLSTFDDTAHTYRSGGYANPIHFRVVPFRKVIKPYIKKVFQGFMLENKTIGLCSFMKDNKEWYALCSHKEMKEILEQGEYDIWSLDYAGHTNGGVRMIGDDTIIGIFKKLLIEHRQNNLYYDSYELLEIMISQYASGLFNGELN